MGIEHRNYYLNRNKTFDPRGRYESAEQALLVDLATRKYLKNHNIDYKFIDTPDELRVETIMKDLNL